MRTSEQINELTTALSKAQGAMRPAELNCVNPHFKSKYADLASINDAIRKPMTDNGLSYLLDVMSVQGGVSCSVKLFHSSGQWIEMEPLIMPVAKATAHSVGGAITYARRYALSAALGVVAEEEDDGNNANSNAPAPNEMVATLSEEQIKWAQGITSHREGLEAYICESYSVQTFRDVPMNCFKDLCQKLQPYIEAQAKVVQQ